MIYRSKHNEEGSRFWQKSNENMILFVEDASQLVDQRAGLSVGQPVPDQEMILLDNVVGPYVRTVVAPI